MRYKPNPAEKILTVCAWCKAVIFDGPVGPNGEISHGICPVCESKFDEEPGEDPVDSDYELARRALS